MVEGNNDSAAVTTGSEVKVDKLPETVEEWQEYNKKAVADYTLKLDAKDRYIKQLQKHCSDADAKVAILAEDNSKLTSGLKLISNESAELRLKIKEIGEIGENYDKFRLILEAAEQRVVESDVRLSRAIAQIDLLKQASITLINAIFPPLRIADDNNDKNL